jgi:hypothetical protein
MGKGNFILGTGSSSIGDVTFARRNGQQIARVRVRKIKNPRSYGQAEQRMISAEVVKFYAPLSGVLETSFEGLSKSMSYAKFLSVNMNIARAEGYGVKKGAGWIPLPLQLSAGSLGAPNVDDQGSLAVKANDSGLSTIGELSSAIIAANPLLQNGDQITFIYSVADDKYTPKYGRFFLNTASTDPSPAEILYVSGDNHITAANVGGGDNASQAWIFSRWDGEKWARSTSFNVVKPDLLGQWQGDAVYDAAVRSFMNGGGRTPVSDVYLNGDDGQ